VTRARLRVLLPLAAALAVVVPLAWMWQSSRLPDTYSVMDMGYVDTGGGAPLSTGGHAMPGMHHGSSGGSMHGATSVTDLVETRKGPPDVSVTLTARKETVELASGDEVEGYTVNGTSPGPTIEATQGDLVEVRLVNESVPDGVSLHWHGVDVPNAEDGVAGVTQDAVPVGGTHTYRFVAEQVGTYWWHSHQVSHVQVKKGLLGALVVHPRGGVPQDVEALALAHTYASGRTLDGQAGAVRVEAEPGDRVRLRVVNTDNTALDTWSDVPFRVVALDGYDVNEPTPVTDRKVLVTAGGRADLEVTVPASGAARVQVGKATWLVVGPTDAAEPTEPAQPRERLDVLAYGSPVALPFDAEHPDREFDDRIGRRPGFVDGRPGVWWSINGHLFPDVPMFVVEEGDVVVMDIKNSSGATHPMHLHGHHAVVLSKDGKAATGSPFWMDSLEVESGESYRIAFLADNPGIWMDHCHNLPHATQGLVAHLMYAGVTTPFRIGHGDNHPE
jgi:FtsP/CotA-like multicopper oxidase with cupredoxin domain